METRHRYVIVKVAHYRHQYKNTFWSNSFQEDGKAFSRSSSTNIETPPGQQDDYFAKP